MLGPEKELDASAAACVSLSLSTGVFQLEDELGLALAEPGRTDTDTEADGVADAGAVPALAVGTAELDAGALTGGAPVTFRVTAGWGGAWTGGCPA
ncbi:hypothetical protein [Arthrobacter sp. EpRS71]|uniref:hypothetical protein n=1 Tax=Arthrobacter sp. EpRS71 TaxID=1743141 RepID=UPI000746319F|nr:hypothetical protein [Arthrobacter sp. EpRS71]KUM40430.1 hypothetical protein AR689_03340 [Arthrobacter sp. EpRS71]